jgi:hypothetical protein
MEFAERMLRKYGWDDGKSFFFDKILIFLQIKIKVLVKIIKE